VPRARRRAVTNDEDLRATLVGLIRSTGPRSSLARSNGHVFGGSTSITATTVRRLGPARRGRPAAAMRSTFPRRARRTRCAISCERTHEPDVVVDVSQTIDTKVKASSRIPRRWWRPEESATSSTSSRAGRPSSGHRLWRIVPQCRTRVLRTPRSTRPRSCTWTSTRLRVRRDTRRPEPAGQTGLRGRSRSARSSRARATRLVATACTVRCRAFSHFGLSKPDHPAGRFERYESTRVSSTASSTTSRRTTSHSGSTRRSVTCAACVALASHPSSGGPTAGAIGDELGLLSGVVWVATSSSPSWRPSVLNRAW